MDLVLNEHRSVNCQEKKCLHSSQRKIIKRETVEKSHALNEDFSKNIKIEISYTIIKFLKPNANFKT